MSVLLPGDFDHPDNHGAGQYQHGAGFQFVADKCAGNTYADSDQEYQF